MSGFTLPIIKSELLPETTVEQYFEMCDEGAQHVFREEGEFMSPMLNVFVVEGDKKYDAMLCLQRYPADIRPDIARALLCQLNAKAVVVTMESWLKHVEHGEEPPEGSLEGQPGVEEHLVMFRQTMSTSEMVTYKIHRDPISLELDEMPDGANFGGRFTDLLVSYAPAARA